ncbi:MAG: TolC family protein [Candidatus Krumholzibacteriales bacterium]
MKCMITLLCLLLISGSASPAERVLTFEEAVALAMKRNPGIAAARNDAEIAGNNASIGNAGLLPRLDFRGSANYTGSDPPSGPETETSITSAQLSASYTLFNGLGNIYGYRQLRTEEKINRLSAREQIENIIIQVSRAYYGAAEAFENLRVSRDLLEISRERLDRVKNRTEFGQGGTVDILAARVDYNTDTVTVVKARFAWEEAMRNLNSLLNRDVGEQFEVDPKVELARLRPLGLMREKALENNSSYRQAVESVESASLGHKIARSEFMPQLDLSTSYGWDQYSDGLDFNLNDPTAGWGVQATLSFNIFNGFRRWTDVRNASIRVRSRQLMEDQSLLELDRELVNAYESYSNSRTVLQLEKNNLESARVNFERTSDLYDLGRVTSTQFREAQLNLTRAETNVISATYTAKLNEIELMKITGELVTRIDSGPEG